MIVFYQKIKKKRDIQPLRDPIDNNLLPIFLTNAGNLCQRKKEIRSAQLRITYIILFHTGLRINEIRHLKQKDLQTALDDFYFLDILFLNNDELRIENMKIPMIRLICRDFLGKF